MSSLQNAEAALSKTLNFLEALHEARDQLRALGSLLQAVQEAGKRLDEARAAEAVAQAELAATRQAVAAAHAEGKAQVAAAKADVEAVRTAAQTEAKAIVADATAKAAQIVADATAKADAAERGARKLAAAISEMRTG